MQWIWLERCIPVHTQGIRQLGEGMYLMMNVLRLES